MPAVLMKLNDAIVKQKITNYVSFSFLLFFFCYFFIPSRWHCIVLCWVLHLSSIELQQPQRRSLFNIRRQHQQATNDAATTQGRNYGNGLEAFIRDGRCALVIPPGPHGYYISVTTFMKKKVVDEKFGFLLFHVLDTEQRIA